MSRPLLAYFAHSYRAPDRGLNRAVWEVCWELGITCMVEPRWASQLCLPHMEVMMRRSDCFIAVAPHRPHEDRFRTSPYIVVEHDLAIRARKPSVVIVEANVPGHLFTGSRVVPVHRDDVGPIGLRDQLRRLVASRGAGSGSAPRVLGSVGLVLPRCGTYVRARRAIGDVLESAGYEVVDVCHAPGRAPSLADVARHDFLVIDVDDREVSSWLHALFHGWCVPMVRLAHHDPVRGRGPHIPQVLREVAVERAGGSGQYLLPWSTLDQLVAQLGPVLDRMQRSRREFRSREEGVGYFQGLGRSAAGPVFISSCEAQRDLAGRLCRALDVEGIDFFHYQHRNPIPNGTPWERQLWDRIEGSRLFVPLLSEEYWRSRLCREEYELAQSRGLRICPCFLGGVDSVGLAARLQGEWLVGLTVEEQVAKMVRAIDGCLATPGGRSWTGPGVAPFEYRPPRPLN